MSRRSIGVIGAGSVGLAIAAEYSFSGYSVILSEVNGFFDRLEFASRLLVEGVTFNFPEEGMKNGIEPKCIDLKTTLDYADFNRANCEAVFVVTTAHPHEMLLPKLDEVLDKHIPIIVVCGNGSVPAWISSDRCITETSTAPYGVRISCIEQLGIHLSVKILTPRFGVSGTSECVAKALSIIQPVYREAFAFSHRLDALLSNPNPLMHVSIMLANLTKLDRRTKYTFYDEGVGASVLKVIQAKDAERMAIGAAAGLQPLPFDEMESVIPIQGQLVTQHFLECGSISKILAPTTIQDRYFTEDVPFGLVAWESLGKRFGVPTPIISAEIEMVSAILSEDLREKTAARTARIVQSL